MRLLPDNAVLLVIDVQKGFDASQRGRRNNPEAERNIARLLDLWRSAGLPVFHVQHDSTDPGSLLHPSNPGHEIKDEAKPLPGEPVVHKSVNSAFIGTDLEARLRRQGFETLVMVGLTTPHCVSSTARMGANLGFDVYVVGNATASFEAVGSDRRRFDAETVQSLSLATIHGEFAEVVDVETVEDMVNEARKRGWSKSRSR